MADVGLHDLDLADIAHQAHGVGQVGLADRHAHPRALAREGPDDLGPDEPGTAEYGDKVWHGFRAPWGGSGSWG